MLLLGSPLGAPIQESRHYNGNHPPQPDKGLHRISRHRNSNQTYTLLYAIRAFLASTSVNNRRALPKPADSGSALVQFTSIFKWIVGSLAYLSPHLDCLLDCLLDCCLWISAHLRSGQSTISSRPGVSSARGFEQSKTQVWTLKLKTSNESPRAPARGFTLIQAALAHCLLFPGIGCRPG